MSQGRQLRNGPRPDYREVMNVVTEEPSKRGHPLPALPQPEGLKERAPASYIQGPPDIAQYFNSRIKDQATSINRFATALSKALTASVSDWGENKARIHKLTLAGTSGSGKTETVLRLKHFLGMDPGYEYEHQCVKIDGSTLSDESQVNSVTGAAAGLLGYKDGNSLADRLNRAQTRYCGEEEREIQRLDPRSPEYRSRYQAFQKKLKTMTAEERPAPPYILLFIDEVDKVSNAFMISINGLLETGHFESLSSSFTLSPQTVLLIVSTCNYGAKAIATMEKRNDDVAVDFIKEAMYQKGLQPYTIGRLGILLPYYPLPRNVLKRVMLEKLENYINNTRIASKFGIQAVNVTEGVKDLLVEHVLDKVDEEYGVRGGLSKLFEQLDSLFETGFAVLMGMLKHEKDPSKPSQPIHIDKYTFDTAQFGETLDKELDSIMSSVIENIKKDPNNMQALANVCNDQNTTTIDAVSMRYGHRALCSLIMIHVTHVVNHYAKEKDYVKKYKKLKTCLLGVADAVKKQPHKAVSNIIEHNQDLLQSSDESQDEASCSSSERKRPRKKKALPPSSPDDEEEDSTVQEPPLKKIKHQEEQEEELTQTMEIETSLVSENAVESDSDEYTLLGSGSDGENEEGDFFLNREAAMKMLTAFMTGIPSQESDKISSAQENSNNNNNNKRRGRPAKECHGFTHLGSNRSHHSQMRCNNCKKAVDARYLTKHECASTTTTIAFY